jgi:hypothetical protein
MLRSDEELVDVTLSCEGKRIRAHKMLLSACSTYFRDLFKVKIFLFNLLLVSSDIRIFFIAIVYYIIGKSMSTSCHNIS